MARVVLENISKTYDTPKRPRVEAVRNFSLDVASGEFLVILGPSGGGKTTILRLVAGLEQPTSGALSIDGKPMAGIEPHERDVAMVFQQPALYPHMTAFENIAFGLKLRKIPPPEITARVRKTAELLGLIPLLDRTPAEISGGERQRVSLGRALVREPKVFLFDEALANLDAPLRAELRAEFVRLHRLLGATMLYVTHDQAEAIELAHRVVVMNKGEVQQVAEPKTLLQQPANDFVKQFLVKNGH